MTAKLISPAQIWVSQNHAYSIRLFRPFLECMGSQTLEALLSDSNGMADGTYRIGIIFLSLSKWDTDLERAIRANEFVEIWLEITNSIKQIRLKSPLRTQLFYSINELLPKHVAGIFTFNALAQRVEELIYQETYSVYEKLLRNSKES